MRRFPILVCALWVVSGEPARGDEARTCEPGIYLEQPGREPVKLTTTPMGGPSMKGMAGGMAKSILTGGLLGGPSTGYAFAGARSANRSSSDVSFKFCFDPAAGTPSEDMNPEQAMGVASAAQAGMPYGATRPQDFSLVRLKVDGETRTMTLGGMMGNKPKNKVDFHVEPLGGAGAFRVRAKQLLTPGEYGFFHMQAGGIFDFAIE